MKYHHRIIVFLLAGLLLLPAIVMAQDPTPTATNVTIHVVQRGENLFRIAMQYGTTVDNLTSLNGLQLADSIAVGQRLLVPATAGAALPLLHIVQPGETLASIAALYGLSADGLAERNSIADAGGFYVGLALDVSPVDPVSEPQTESSGTPLIHTVLRGETLYRIAMQYGTTVNAIATANRIANPETIYAGQQLIIPGVEVPQLALDLPQPITGFDVYPLILVEGQSGRIRLSTSVPVTIAGTFLDRGLAVANEADNTIHTMLVGIPVGTTVGIYPLSLTLTDTSGVQTAFDANIQVVGGNYYREYINLLADRGGLLDPVLEGNELALVESLMKPFTPTRYFDGPMGLPAAAPLSSRFGNLRAYNGGAFERIHAGTDFAGAPGAPVLATAAGRVVFSDLLNVRGQATIIDHGWGVYTGYWHQTERYVRVGETVTTGQVIGTVGSTGRVTGAHLHWEVWVNGVPVDPMQWVQQSFS